MVKKFILGYCFLPFAVWSNELSVEITSLTNIKGNGAMEACGSVSDYNGKTVLVTISHDESTYTTLTDENGKWCQVIKRWTFNGKINAKARVL